MEFVASTLGLRLPHHSARAAVMKRNSGRCQRRPLPFLTHRDSMLCLADLKATVDSKFDDDTASTVSSSDSFTSGGSVSFAQPLVTAIYERPATSPDEKERLYYADRDYRSFRREYHLCGKKEPRDPMVSFSETVVSRVYVYPNTATKDVLYYSEDDLKRFLNEFVDSLTQR